MIGKASEGEAHLENVGAFVTLCVRDLGESK
jgi:hypothetical protein